MLLSLRYKQRLSSQNEYIKNSLKRGSAIAVVDRIKKYGSNEMGDPLRWSKWFEQQLRLTADNRLRHVLTTGASQISKSLGNYLVAIDDLINGQINLAWIYASRTSMNNQQPSQFGAMIKHWLDKQSVKLPIERDAISRYRIGKATANFSYANSASEANNGGAAEGKEQNSFQASKLYLEEKSSWKKNVDMTPRLGASVLPSKPIRELGTPGNGGGIEKAIAKVKHNFIPGVFCDRCDQLSWMHPLGNLFKSVDDEYFDQMGHIKAYFNHGGKPFIACNNCNADITHLIADIELYSHSSLQSIDEFLDELPEDESYYPSVAIYLSPLLMVASDPNRLIDLVIEGSNPDNVMIFHQNKLGVESKFNVLGVDFGTFEKVFQPPFKLNVANRSTKRFVGIDQGTQTHYLVDMTVEGDLRNINATIEIREDEIIPYLRKNKIDFALIDNEPGRLSANELSKASMGVLAIADQRSIMSNYSEITVSYGGMEIPCYAINNVIFNEIVIKNFLAHNYRLNCIPHKDFQRHITSIKRDIHTGQFIRPADHRDDFFFTLMFAEAAATIYGESKRGSTSFSTAIALKKFHF